MATCPRTPNGNIGYQGRGRARLEKLFYQRALPLLQYGGVLIFIVPPTCSMPSWSDG